MTYSRTCLKNTPHTPSCTGKWVFSKYAKICVDFLNWVCTEMQENEQMTLRDLITQADLARMCGFHSSKFSQDRRRGKPIIEPVAVLGKCLLYSLEEAEALAKQMQQSNNG